MSRKLWESLASDSCDRLLFWFLLSYLVPHIGWLFHHVSDVQTWIFETCSNHTPLHILVCYWIWLGVDIKFLSEWNWDMTHEMHGMTFFVAKAEGLLQKIGAHRRCWARSLRNFCWKFHEICFLPIFVQVCWWSPDFARFFVKNFFRRFWWQIYCFCNISGKRTWNGWGWCFRLWYVLFVILLQSSRPNQRGIFHHFPDQLGVPCHFLGRNWLIAFTPSMVVEKEVTYKTSDDACGYY